MSITQILQKWYAVHKRRLPWRETGSPYHIWLSEIILQQTRVNQGLSYYNKFLEKYPRVEDLAAAPLDNVLKLWQGLGYYTRARNLHETAKAIVEERNGVFPDNYKDLQKLKGIGIYTAAAIASLAFREPVAVVDGNVFRVLSRIFGITSPIDTTRGKSEIHRLASKILDKNNPHVHNQAMMELGALVCLPKNPRCHDCPLTQDCYAYLKDKTGLLPVRSERRSPRDRYFNYVFITNSGYTWINRRVQKDIWHSLFEFPLIETGKPVNFEYLSNSLAWDNMLGNFRADVVGKIRHYRHQLTHQTIHGSFYHVNTREDLHPVSETLLKIRLEDLELFAFSGLIGKFLTDLNNEAH